jgi:CelD/BcsL family acetyltransferase involved in cellulose biosynthesis
MRHGPAYQRRLAKVPESLEAYIAALGKKTRQDLRRQERRLVNAAEDEVTFSVFSSPDEVESFLAAVEQVSRLTYQWNLLGIGIRQRESTTAMLKQAAHQGRLRGYTLRVKGEPIAFMIGYLDGGTYYSESIGYHPDWAKYSAGNVLHLYVMRDLSDLDRKVEWFDFMYGDNSNKARLSTDYHEEQNIYLIPKTLRWRLIVGALEAFNSLTDNVSSVLDRYGIKEKIRRAMRARAVQKPRQKEK